ncbi:MAG: Gfo/Idh/MocA family oxidoreductase [Chloroflexota bacterium]
MTKVVANPRVAFIGAGKIIQVGHIPSFQGLDNVETVAVCDINLDRAKEVAAEKGVAAAYDDYEKMLTEVQPDITVIATPNIFHKPMTIAALNAGSHVLCEKPLALTYEDAKEMMDTAAANDLALHVGTHYRWNAPMQVCKRHVDGGFFGDIYAAKTTWHRRSGIPGFGSWFTRKNLAGGGCLLDIGIHAIDSALYLMGYPNPVTVSAVTFSKMGTQGIGLGGWGADIHNPGEGVVFDVDDLAWGLVRFDNGATLIVQISWAVQHAEEYMTQILGDKGGASVGTQTVDLYTHLNGQTVDIQAPVPRMPDSYPTLIKHFVDYVGGNEDAPIVTARESLIDVQIVDGMFRSAQEGREVTV